MSAELETTNKELQATVEDLETINAELRSTNEELLVVNDELRQRSEDLNRANQFLESILTGIRSVVVVVDRQLRVIAWNHRAEDLWGLRSEDVRGQNLLALDIGLPTEQLRSKIRACLAGAADFTISLDAMNRRGRVVHCKVTATPLSGDYPEPRGVILLMEELGASAPFASAGS
jgi:two-component system CheB/CheR fusion protein